MTDTSVVQALSAVMGDVIAVHKRLTKSGGRRRG